MPRKIPTQNIIVEKEITESGKGIWQGNFNFFHVKQWKMIFAPFILNIICKLNFQIAQNFPLL